MTKYNGYTNWETWNVSLWFNNDEPLYRAYRRQAPFNAESAEMFVKDLLPSGTPDMDSSSEYNDVDWDEIAEVFNEL